MLFVYIALAAIALAGLYFLWKSGPAYVRFRGTRLVTCPENQHTAAVAVDAKQAALSGMMGPPTLRLEECSRWPERAGCGQACLAQIEAAPEDCLLRTILVRWYEGKSCVLCRKPFGEINWIEHHPALMDRDRRTKEWRDVRPESVPEVLASHWPVCWDCHIAETFRAKYPDLITDRDWQHLPRQG